MKKGTALKEIFNDFLKNELKDIAKQKKIRGYSTLNKEQLIDKIVEHMLNDEEVEKYFQYLTNEEIEAVKKEITSTEGGKSNDALYEKLYAAGYLGGMNNGEIVVPVEVQAVLEKIENKEFNEKRKVTSFLLSSLRTMCVLYGKISIDLLMQIMKDGINYNESTEELINRIESIPEVYNEFEVNDNVVSHKRLSDSEDNSIKDESKYYIPTVEEINTIGVYGELPNGPSNVELVSSVVKENTGENKAARKVISNPTRIDDSIPWTFDNMGKRLVNQPVVKTKKVYPNDKCPCGRGKKYKYCCGR